MYDKRRWRRRRSRSSHQKRGAAGSTRWARSGSCAAYKTMYNSKNNKIITPPKITKTNKINETPPRKCYPLTNDERQQETPDGQEATRVPDVVQGHRRLHQPLAPPDGSAELVAHGQDGEPLPGRPILAVGHGLDLGEVGENIQKRTNITRLLLEDTTSLGTDIKVSENSKKEKISLRLLSKDTPSFATVVKRYHISRGCC